MKWNDTFPYILLILYFKKIQDELNDEFDDEVVEEDDDNIGGIDISCKSEHDKSD